MNEGAQATQADSGSFEGVSGASSRRRFGWGLADQALSSLTNFAIGLLLARSLSLSEFGAFGIAFSAYLLALAVSRSMATEPLVVRYSSVGLSRWVSGTRAASGFAVGLGTVFSTAAVVAAWFSPPALSSALVALAITFPGLLLQDAWRFAFFARGNGRNAFLNDLIWALVLLPVFAVLILGNKVTVFLGVLAWGASATVAGLFGIYQARVFPNPGAMREWFRDHRDLIPRFAVEELALSFAHQLKYLGLGAVADLAAVGAFRAAEVLLGPSRILTLGVRVVAIPEAVRLLNHSRQRFLVVIASASSLLGATLLSIGVVAYLLPNPIGELLLGPAWRAAQPIVLPVAISISAGGITMGAVVALRALQAARESMRMRLLFSGCMLSGAVLGGAAAGAAGAAWTVSVVSTLGSGLWWAVLLRTVRRKMWTTVE